MTSTLIRPSHLLPQGLRLERSEQLTLFKFTDELGQRMQDLLDKKKEDRLTPDEAMELEVIGELDDIFSYINAVMLAETINARP